MLIIIFHIINPRGPNVWAQTHFDVYLCSTITPRYFGLKLRLCRNSVMFVKNKDMDDAKIQFVQFFHFSANICAGWLLSFCKLFCRNNTNSAYQNLLEFETQLCLIIEDKLGDLYVHPFKILSDEIAFYLK